MRLSFSFAIGAWLATCAWSQAIVEHAVITGGTSVGAGAAAGPGKSLGDILNNLIKTLQAGSPGSTPSTAPAAGASQDLSSPQPLAASVAAAAPAAEAKPFVAQVVNPDQITQGMDRGALLSLYGKPSMQMAQNQDSVLVETYWYDNAAHQSVVVTLRNGSVATVKAPAKAAAAPPRI